MAKNKAVWGIDIGQCALKAMRCVAGDDPSKVTADAFDFIEYPKILSQPDADPAALVADALQQFLSRNSVKGDKVCISVPGQNGLARFIKLPPVEKKKIPDIVKYEAKQQIPFALEEVVWSYQQMAGGMEADGFVLESEVGLFAMKREQVAKALRPFQEANIEVDLVQLTPLTLFNFVVFDQMPDLPPPEAYDADSCNEWTALLAMGTDTTDLVITNGFRVWLRNIAIGGNHFTKALTKDLKLTFAKAEHQKRNASHAEDAKVVFQAMRPVFTDMVTEVQRSIGFFGNIDRKAKVSRIVAMGNGMKLPGLQRFLAQNLGIEVDRIETFRALDGSAVIDAPTFKENLPSFGVCYGLALQGLQSVRINTNLLPPEIVQDRLIKSKKPWMAAAAALLMTGMAFSFGGNWRAWNSVHAVHWTDALSTADTVKKTADGYVSEFTTAKGAFQTTEKVGVNLRKNIEGRLLWAEILQATNACLPESKPLDFKNIPALRQNPTLNIDSIECEYFEKLEDWFTSVSEYYRDPNAPAPAAAPTPAAGQPAPAGGAAAAPKVEGPKGPGWVIQLTGYHLHNPETRINVGADYVINTLIKNLHEEQINGIPIRDLGISHATLINPGLIDTENKIELPEEEGEDDKKPQPGGNPLGNMPGGMPGMPGMGNSRSQGKTVTVPRFDFLVQFCWVETPPSKRLEKQKEREKAAAAAAGNFAENQ